MAKIGVAKHRSLHTTPGDATSPPTIVLPQLAQKPPDLQIMT